MTWSKLIALGTGPGLDVIALTWNGNDYGALEMQVYNNWYPAWLGGSESEMEFVHQPAVNTWYHMLWVSASPNTTNWRSTYSVYLNGRLASGPRPGMVHPLPITRTYAWLGQSLWSDPNANVTFDAIRMYDYALNATHAAQLASLYNLYTGASPDQLVSSTPLRWASRHPTSTPTSRRTPTYLAGRQLPGAGLPVGAPEPCRRRRGGAVPPGPGLTSRAAPTAPPPTSTCPPPPAPTAAGAGTGRRRWARALRLRRGQPGLELRDRHQQPGHQHVGQDHDAGQRRGYR